MRIKYVDKDGSQCVATVPGDDVDYNVGKDEDGTFYVYADIPHARLKRQPPKKILAELLDKSTADKCIVEIYNQLKENNTFCDLVGIQSGKSEDTTAYLINSK